MKFWKRFLKCIAVTICVGMLAGCGAKQETVVTPTPTEVVTVAPTEVVVPTVGVEPTAEPTTVPTEVPATEAPKATATAVPTATSTPVPTEKPTATNTPVSTEEPTKAPVATDKDALTGLNAFEITSQMIVGWNLGNTLDSIGYGVDFDSAPMKFVTSWGNIEPTQELFEAVKAGGFNTVRIPTTWYQHVKYDNSQDKYIINEEWLAYVKKTVDYAYDLDMFVILNVHHEDTWVNVPAFTDAAYNTASKMLHDIWETVAETFKDYDQHLIFEGMNEPREKGSSTEWSGGTTAARKYVNKLNAVFVDTVRSNGSAANTERLLMIPDYAASSDLSAIKAVEIPENGGNIALSVHAYYPYYFAMATDKQANHSFPGKSGYGEDYKSSITYLFNELKKISDNKNVPIIIGEFGASDFNNDEDRARWASHFLTCAKKAGIPCVFWDNGATYNGTGEAYGLIYRQTCTWFESAIPMLNAVMEVYGRESSLPRYVAYEKPAFDWNTAGIGSDWVQIFRADDGQQIDDWGNIWLDGWKDYLNEKFDIVVFFDSEKEPYMVLQGGWHKVYSENGKTSEYEIRFTLEDALETMEVENVKLSDMTGYYVSASGKKMTVYGVYAVPVK